MRLSLLASRRRNVRSYLPRWEYSVVCTAAGRVSLQLCFDAVQWSRSEIDNPSRGAKTRVGWDGVMPSENLDSSQKLRWSSEWARWDGGTALVSAACFGLGFGFDLGRAGWS